MKKIHILVLFLSTYLLGSLLWIFALSTSDFSLNPVAVTSCNNQNVATQPFSGGGADGDPSSERKSSSNMKPHLKASSSNLKQDFVDIETPYSEFKVDDLPPYKPNFYYPKRYNLTGWWFNRDPKRKSSRNVVIGMAPSLPACALQTFCQTLRQIAKYSDDLIMGFYEVDIKKEAILEVVKNYNVMAYIVPEIPELKVLMPKLIQAHRYAFYREWIYPYRGNDRFVIVADVRDALFQSDPFADAETLFPDGVNLHFSQEDPSQVLGHNIWNRNKIGPVYGDDVLDFYENRTVLCSGVIWGRGNEMYRLMRYMIDEMVAYNFSYGRPPTGTPSCCDQGYFNILYYSGKLDNLGVKSVPYGDGIVATVGYADQIIRDSSGYILIGPSVVEQMHLKQDFVGYEVIAEKKLCQPKRIEVYEDIMSIMSCYMHCINLPECSHFAYFPISLYCQLYDDCDPSDLKRSADYCDLCRVLERFKLPHDGLARAPIVHQFDRHQFLTRWAKSEFGWCEGLYHRSI